MEAKDHYITLILKVLSNEAVDQDFHDIEQLEKSNSEYHELRDIIEKTWNLQYQNDQEAAYQKVLNRIVPQNKLPVNRLSKLSYYNAAAVLLIGILLAQIVLFIFNHNTGTVYETGQAEFTTIVLPDNSQVTLYENSSLKVDDDFLKEGTRTVTLVGEAYFDVVKLSETPFIVHTNDLKIKVLGTSFNVRAYQSDKQVETTLLTGKVEVYAQENFENNVVLIPNEAAIYTKASKELAIKKADIEKYEPLATERLQFINSSVANVLVALSKRHNVSIVASPQIKNCTLTADFTDLTMDVSLEILADIIEVTYEKKGGDISIKGTGCK